MKIRSILWRWGRSNYQNYPWREVEKRWHGLLAEILLQRTKAKSVVNVFEQFVKKYPQPYDLALADKKDVETLMYPLGLRWRVPLIIEFAKTLNEIGGVPPDSFENLIKLPGVGTYVAAAYLAFHENKRAVIIDTNVVRWICRLMDAKCDNETRRKKWFIELADKITPRRNVKDFNYSMLDFTMQICSKVPRCQICPIGPKLCLTGRKVLN